MNIGAWCNEKKESVFGSATKTRVWEWTLELDGNEKKESVFGSATKKILWEWILEIVVKKKKKLLFGSATKKRLRINIGDCCKEEKGVTFW